jgi:DNA-binding MarR family transcriptional regulator
MKIEEAIKQSKFNSIQEKAIINILYTANFIEDRFKDYLKQKDLSLPQYNVLRILRGRKGGFATCGELKAVMLDKNPDVTRLCDKLITKGLIQRQNNPKNKREIHLSISKNGLAAIDEIHPAFIQFHNKLLALESEELEKLSDTLDAIRATL